MAKRHLTPADLLGFELAGDVQMSPDGGRVAYTLTRVNQEKNEYDSRIYVVQEGREPVPYTAGPKDATPRWSPDGRYLAFVSQRSGAGQIWLLPTAGGEAQQLTRVKGGVNGIAWSPDGRHLAFTAKVNSAGLQPEARDEEESDLFKKHTRGVKVIDRALYKMDGVGFYDPEKYGQIGVIAVDGGEPRLVTAGPYHHTEPAWSPCGRFLALVANRREDWDYYPSHADVWVAAVNPDAAAAEPLPVTDGSLGASKPVWSPDGRSICFVGTRPPEQGYDNPQLYVAPVPAEVGGVPTANAGAPAASGPRCLTGGWDRPIGDETICDTPSPAGGKPVWSPDGRSVYAAASDGGTTHLYRFDAATGAPARVTAGDRVVFSFDLSPDCRRAALGAGDPLNPSNVFLADLARPGAASASRRGDPPHLTAPAELAGYREAQLTSHNAALLGEVELSVPERFWFQAPGGPPIDGWVMKPVGCAPGGKYPAVLEIHGGPMGMYGAIFFFEFQLLAASGYGVVFTNPRGSLGYGHEFCACIRGQWGDKDYADCMAGIAAAVQNHAWIDPERLGVAGGSYGGFMVNWIIGHSNRFKAAVTMRSVVNRMSAMGTSDTGYNRVPQYGPLWWEDPSPYLQQSPLTYISNCTTPLLIEHQENDLRCPIDQGEQLYAALKVLRRKVKFVRYPGEFHGMSRSGKPWHRVHRLMTIAGWFNEHLRTGN